MIIVKLIWWLGNQLFQYALGKRLSRDLNLPLYLDTAHFSHDIRSYELDEFNITASIATQKERPWYQRVPQNKYVASIRYPIQRILKKLDPRYIIENPLHPKVHRWMYDFQPHILEIKKSYLYLEWFRQSEKYFDSIKDEVRSSFVLKVPLSDEKNSYVIEKITSCMSVSVHVRRSDYIWSHYAGICDVDYYERAINYINNHVSNATFFVFSDDIARCKEHLPVGNNAQFIDRNTDKNSYKDLILMSTCKHNIIANSSFSRRGARLNSHADKIVIAPTKWHQNLDYKDIVPVEWIRI